MKKLWLVLGTSFVCVVTAQAQNKMPVPVEDDPTAPPELHSHASQPTKPGTAPATPHPGPAASAPPEVNEPGTPYSQAMVAYRAGDYDKAYSALEGTDPATQDDNFIILESHILSELKRYDDGEKLLKARIQIKEQNQAKPAELDDLFTALGDLFLHKRAFDRALKFYTAAQQDKHIDLDLTLKLVYAHIGDNDLRGADQLATTLSPFDPKHPYDDHPVYYFAHAALAQAIGRTQDAEDDIQQARTNYGVTVTNRYLKTYLHLFAVPSDKSEKVPSAIVPTPAKH